MPHTAHGDIPLSFWPRVREFAVPPTMIETATVRRLTGDWAGACAAAGFDVDLNLRAIVRDHGRDVGALIRDDLRHLAPDLLRWHMPRVAPDGVLRPGLTIPLAQYGSSLHLVVRTPPAWASAGQRVSLALWDRTRRIGRPAAHPHPHPHRRFRLDLHRHLWDARRADELRERSGADRPPSDDVHQLALGRWADEARILLASEGGGHAPFTVRLAARDHLVLIRDPEGTDAPGLRILPPSELAGDAALLSALPDAAVWTLPDLLLLRAGRVTADALHPLVAAALVPGHPPPRERSCAGQPFRTVECRGARHRLAVVDGVLTPLDHDPAEIRREELLAALSGTPLPCLHVIDRAHRQPACLPEIRDRLAYGDVAGALAVVEDLLGPDALLRDGALRDALDTAARGRIAHGLYRAGLSRKSPVRCPEGDPPRRRRLRRERSVFH